MVEQSVRSTSSLKDGTKVTYFRDGGLQVVASPRYPDSRVAGKTFYRWKDGNYVEYPPEESPTVTVIICQQNKDAMIEVRPRE